MKAKVSWSFAAVAMVAGAAFYFWPAAPLPIPAVQALAPSAGDLQAAQAPPRYEAAVLPAGDSHSPVEREAHSADLPEGRATVVEIQPQDEVPEPERFDGAPQENDPLLPELPQTAEWKHGKTVHIAALLEHQLRRLDADLEQAVAAGDAMGEARLRIAVERRRKRLGALHSDAEALAAEAIGVAALDEGHGDADAAHADANARDADTNAADADDVADAEAATLSAAP